jgi:hypothetical protein
MAWLALEQWAKQANAGAVIGSSIKIRNTSLDDCLKMMWPGSSSRPAAYDLILAWGFDLQRSLEDRHARNNSSYTPQALNPIHNAGHDTLDFAAEFWQSFEPDPSDPFLILDRHLFRIMVETQFSALGGRAQARVLDISKRYQFLPAGVQSVISSDFLTRQSEALDSILIQLGGTNSAPPKPTELICRAALLLRSATAMVTDALFKAGVAPQTDLAFWLESYGEELGLWAPGDPPSPMYELWADVRQALDDALAARSNCASSCFSRFDWASAAINGMPRIFETERIALWSLCV